MLEPGQRERLIGAKVSLGDRPAERHATTEEPRLGWLTDGMLLSGPELDPSDLIHPRVEAKVAFLLARPLRGRVRTVADLLALTECVLPCLDIVDVRYQEADVDRVDEIADNCAAAKLLVGAGIPAPSEEQLLRIRVRLDVEPAPAARARVQPTERISPVAATLWLANRVIEEGGELEPGALLVAPACCGPLELQSGAQVRAEFSGLGELELETTGVERNG
jgi:2-keto-4-pentenoate hydratase